MQVTRDSELKHTEAKKHNASSKWASAGQKKFSDHLNHFRDIMGHCFIMFTKEASNVIGVGIEGRHWTMMTGRK